MAGLLAASGDGPTPRTPEILNSLMSMTNPFDAVKQPPQPVPAGHYVPPLQHTRSQLIKEGLKLTLQTKRRSHLPPSSPPLDYHPLTPNSDLLTPEDEERRRRRRERNKIAATKCRLKKRERTFNLVHESEILETQNMDLKSQIQDLENEKRRLVDMLSVHRPSCTKSYQGSYQESYCQSRAGYSKQYGKVEISCETTISYHRESEGQWTDCNRQGFDYNNYRPPDCGYTRAQTPRYTRPSSISTSSSDFDSIKDDVDSPTIVNNHYHNFDEESDPYIPMFPLSTVTHS